MRLRSELEASGVALAGLMRDSGNGAGDDEADTGTKNITREHEMALAANATEMLEQTERALARLDAGTYGLCEICGKPIGKARMQAFPGPLSASRTNRSRSAAADPRGACRTLVFGQEPRLRDSRGRGGAHHRYAGHPWS